MIISLTVMSEEDQWVTCMQVEALSFSHTHAHTSLYDNESDDFDSFPFYFTLTYTLLTQANEGSAGEGENCEHKSPKLLEC